MSIREEIYGDIRSRYGETLNVPQACEFLGVNRRTLLTLIEKKDGIKAMRMGKGSYTVYRISAREIARFMSQ